MRRLSILIMGVVCLGANAQGINDVLRYSIQEGQGTARFQALGGAFGALGGDLSALNVNPAGSSVFNYSQFTATGSNYNRNNDALYGSSTVTTELNSQQLNQVGGVFVFKSPNSPWKKIALAINYDLVENFDNEFIATGNSTEGIDNYFLEFAQDVPFRNLLLNQNEFLEEAYLRVGAEQGFGNQQAFLGYFGGIINPVDEADESGTAYLSNASYDNVNQTYSQTVNGHNSKFTLNFSGQYQESLYIGASVNFHSLLYERLTRLDESGFNADSPVQFAAFDNFLRTEGEGFSFSVGAIAKLNESIRIGGSYQSPTWYRLRDDTAQRINSNLADDDINFIDFNIVNLFEDYRIQTPGKVTGSAAIVFGKDGLLSFDYGYQDFSQAELRPNSDPVFADQNQLIASQLGVVNSYRFGGEYRIERLSLRGGYRIEESPYEDSDVIGDLEGFSAGIGYDFGGSRLDLAYARTEQDVNELFFDSGATNNALVNRTNSNIILSFTLKF
ncbi:outer membrane protein transport protein [Muricauda sp. SCSIO 64092]|uniref:OmpP1/FadL family transporter n=1 Tax=Allomuricauda sp. SCSIO 64092 TaxID=2908842 RepID=UPI001FF1DD12|nr:outer membrane protein transport protein [Muricauda sp. SCSIO 64092]UOY05442.1 outer membrane protein transport protein [Muricauda sp. SCSIO 64092]